MNKETWAAVEHYYGALLAPDDAGLEHALQSSEAAGLPRIQVSALQGKLLYLLALMVSARNILEIGTLAGYSTIWMARALPDDGCLITLEASEKHAEIARENFTHAGLAGKIELRLGKALDTLPRIAAESRARIPALVVTLPIVSTRSSISTPMCCTSRAARLCNRCGQCSAGRRGTRRRKRRR